IEQTTCRLQGGCSTTELRRRRSGLYASSPIFRVHPILHEPHRFGACKSEARWQIRSVQQYRSYRFEVRATPEQRALLCRIAGSCRFVYNKALALQRIRVAGGHRRLSYAASCKSLAAWKSDPVLVWLKECPS